MSKFKFKPGDKVKYKDSDEIDPYMIIASVHKKGESFIRYGITTTPVDDFVVYETNGWDYVTDLKHLNANSKFKVGERVVVYELAERFVSKVLGIREYDGAYEVISPDGNYEICVHEKQLRRLKPKKKNSEMIKVFAVMEGSKTVAVFATEDLAKEYIKEGHEFLYIKMLTGPYPF